MNTTQLAYFITLAQTLNYTTAAEQLYITQPTLSRNIMALESELDTQLFSRKGSGVTLTAAGEALYRDIQPLVRQYSALLRRVKNIGQGLAGELVIALSSEQQMPPSVLSALQDFHSVYPNVSYVFQRASAGIIRNGLLDGTIDIGLQLDMLNMQDKAINSVLLAAEQPHLVSAAHFDYPDIITASQCVELLQGENLIFPSPLPLETSTASPLQALQNMLHTPEANPHISFIDDISAVSLYVSSGLGVTICNKTHDLALQPGITMREIRDAEPYKKVLQYRSDSRNPVLSSFLQHLKHHL